MLRPIDLYFMEQEEPVKSCLISLRGLISGFHDDVTEVWRYRMPHYLYKEKRFCYLWIHKQLKQPYIGFTDGYKTEHPDLLQENRSRMKILLIDPLEDLPVEKIRALLRIAIALVE